MLAVAHSRGRSSERNIPGRNVTKCCQQLYKLQKMAGIVKGKKTSSRALEAGGAVLEAKTDNSSNESLFPDEKPKASN